MLDPDVARFVLDELPPPPARVIEIGAGDGSLAHELRERGYDVAAIDPAADKPGVERVALEGVTAPRASFDAAVAVVSLHHVEPLEPSLTRLAEVVRPGGVLVVDEFDVDRVDERAVEWCLARRHDHEHEHPEPADVVSEMREHLHAVATLRSALAPWFDLTPAEPGPYLYRWNLAPGFRPDEEEGIAAGRLPATGVRFTGKRSGA